MKMAKLMLLLSILSTPGWAAPRIEVFKSPTCGCCEAWVHHLQENGFDVSVQETQNLQPVKERAHIPPGKGSCHTSFIEGYVVEGHVPASDIKRLLEERPEAQGLTVPRMPIGSPGMEMGKRRDAYKVLLFQQDGSTEVFSEYPEIRE